MSLPRAVRYTVNTICIGLLLLSQTACTATRLPPYEATYTTKLRGIKIKGVRKFEAIGEDTYKLSWQAKALWMRLDEWSTFKVIDEKVIPISYHYTRKGLGSNRPIHVNFDWEAMQVRGSKGEDNYSYDLEPGALDKLSFQVQMQIDLLMNHKLQSFDYQIATYHRLKHYRFSYLHSETIDTDLGPQHTLVFEREKDDGGTKLWISPSQNYLPIQIENIDEDDSNVLTIRSWDSKTVGTPDEDIAQTGTVSLEDDDFEE